MSQEIDTSIEEQPSEVVANVDEQQSTETEAGESVNNETEEQTANAESVDTDEKKTDEKKASNGYEKRINKLTRQKYEQEARFQAQLEAQEAKFKELEARLTAEPEKQKEDFQNQEEYIAHLVEQQSQKVLQDYLKQEQEKAQQTNTQKAEAEKWQGRVAEFADTTPDYVEVVSGADVELDTAVAEAIQESEYGAQILYEIAKNPDKADMLNGQNPRTLDRNLLRMELELEKTPPVVQEQPKAKVTQAQPTPKSKGNAGTQVDINKLEGEAYRRAYLEAKAKR